MIISKTTINILILTLIVVIIWIGSEAYFAVKKDYNFELDSALTKELVAPIDTSLNFEVIKRLKNLDSQYKEEASSVSSNIKFAPKSSIKKPASSTSPDLIFDQP